MDNKSQLDLSFKELKKHLIPPLAELISTEADYVNRMDLVVNGYIPEFRNKNSEIIIPEDLKEQPFCLIFTNIPEIYEWHKEYFLNALIQNRNSLSEVGKIFTKNQNQFHMYSKYCNFKEISNYLVNKHMNYFDEVKQKLGHYLMLQDLLIAPFRRVMLYTKLLDEIIKYMKKNNITEGLDSLNEAHNTMKIINDNINEFTALQGITNFDGAISAQGKLLFHGSLSCKYGGRKRKLYAFLFKHLILFTVKKGAKGKYDSATYDFRLQIPIMKLDMKELQNNRFLLSSTALTLNIVCHAATIELHHQWMDAIRQQLYLKTDFLKKLVNPSSDEEDQSDNNSNN